MDVLGPHRLFLCSQALHARLVERLSYPACQVPMRGRSVSFSRSRENDEQEPPRSHAPLFQWCHLPMCAQAERSHDAANDNIPQ